MQYLITFVVALWDMTAGFVDIHTHQPKPQVISPKMAGIHPWDEEKNLPFQDFTACDIIGDTSLNYASDVWPEWNGTAIQNFQKSCWHHGHLNRLTIFMMQNTGVELLNSLKE